MINGDLLLDAIASRTEAEGITITLRSGRKERLENLVSRYS
jgi:xylose isomerase